MKSNRLVYLLGIITLLGFSSCSKSIHRIKGSGSVVQQSFDLPPVSAIALSIDANVVMTHGSPQEITIEGQQNIINNIEKYIDKDGFWHIGYYNPVTSHAGITIRISSPTLDYASISGSGNIESTNFYPDTVSQIILKISGSGNISLAANAHIIQSDISGSGKITLSGYADEQSIHVSGSGNIHAFGLKTLRTTITISGSGNSEVWAQNLLDVSISGSGNVYYVGYPSINANITGSGEIHDRN